jgi:hypothetical protein
MYEFRETTRNHKTIILLQRLIVYSSYILNNFSNAITINHRVAAQLFGWGYVKAVVVCPDYSLCKQTASNGQRYILWTLFNGFLGEVMKCVFYSFWEQMRLWNAVCIQTGNYVVAFNIRSESAHNKCTRWSISICISAALVESKKYEKSGREVSRSHLCQSTV